MELGPRPGDWVVFGIDRGGTTWWGYGDGGSADLHCSDHGGADLSSATFSWSGYIPKVNLVKQAVMLWKPLQTTNHWPRYKLGV